MASFDVLSGRLSLDVSGFLRGLQQASAAAQLFAQRIGASLQAARRDIEQLNAAQFGLVAANLPPPIGGASPWSALLAGPASAFNSPTGTTSQTALMGFVLRVNQALEKQAELADQLAEAVARARSELQESFGGQEIQGKLKETAEKVADALEQALDKAQEAGERLKDAIQELADKSEEASEKVEGLSEKIEALGEKSEEADEKVEKLGEKVEELGEKSEEAGEKLEELGEKLQELGRKQPAGANQLGQAQQPQLGFAQAGGGSPPKSLSPAAAAWLAFLANPLAFIAGAATIAVEAGIGEAIQGTQDLQDLIDKKNASGDRAGAIDLEIQNVQERLQQSMFNLHQLSSDPAAGGGFGGFPGTDNSAYFLTLDIPLTREIKSLQAELDQLLKERQSLGSHAKPHKMAAGGIVSQPTSAIVGEAGPEAVLPLTSFGNMLGALPVFTGIQSAMERIGDYFSTWGNNPALAGQYFANLDKIQNVFEYSLDRIESARRLDFTPASMLRPIQGGYMAGAGVGRIAGHPGTSFSGPFNLHFHGVDISEPRAASVFARQLFGALDSEARRLGTSMMGGSVLRSGDLGVSNRAVGYAR